MDPRELLSAFEKFMTTIISGKVWHKILFYVVSNNFNFYTEPYFSSK